MKKGILRKSLIMLSALAMFMSFGISSFAAETITSGNWKYQITTSGLTITGYTGSSQDVKIPEELDGYKVGTIGRRAFKDNATMRTVTIPETITYIGPEAFRGCVALSQINYNAKNCTVPEIWRHDDNRGIGVFSGAGSAASSLTVTFGSKVTDIPANLFNTDSENKYDYAHVTAIKFSDKVKTIGAHAFENCKELETLVFSKNITTVDVNAFYECTSLEKVTFNDDLTEIKDSAFRYCSNLEEIVWGDGLDTIGNNAFRDCTSLEEAHIPEPTSVIGKWAFAHDTSLKEITIPETAATIGAEAFYNTVKLSQINYNAEGCKIPEIWRHDDNRGVGVFSGAGSGARSMNVTFGPEVSDIPQDLFNTDYENKYDYAHLTSITFSNAVKTVGVHAFANCRDLEKVTFGKNVKTINECAFYDCAALEEITFNDKLTTIGTSAFENCVNLETINWGDDLDTIGTFAFKGCTSLEVVNIPESTMVIGRQSFANATSLEELTIPSTVTNIYAEAFHNTTNLSKIKFNAKACTVPEIWRYDENRGVGVFSGAGSGATSLNVTFGSQVADVPAGLFNTDYQNNYDYAHLTSITFSDGVKTIGKQAFEDCRDLETVTFGKNITTLGDYAFWGCVTLEEVTFNDKLAQLGAYAFENCTDLEELTWGDGLDTIDTGAFKGCTSLTEAHIPEPTTVIGRHAFLNATSLEEVTIPSTVTNINAEAFYNTVKLSKINFNAKACAVPEIWRYDENRGVGVFAGAGSGASSLEVIFGASAADIPAGLFNTDYQNKYDYAHVTSVTFKNGVKTIGKQAFEDCRDLEEVVLGTDITSVGDYAFWGCATLEKVSFNDKLAQIGANAFESCANLEEINWGAGLDTIGNFAFKGCTSLTEAHIPEPTTVIGKQAFRDATSLEELTIPTTVTTIGAEAFGNTTKLEKIIYNAKECTVPALNRYDDNKGVGVFTGAGSGTNKLEVTFGTKVVKIPDNLFNTDKENKYDHAYITSVFIPRNVTSIGVRAFDDCAKLTAVRCESAVATVDPTAFEDHSADLVITCYYGTPIAVHAAENSIECIYLPPEKPELKSVTNATKGIKVDWDSSLGAAKYIVLRKTSSFGSWKEIEEITLESGKTYYIDNDVKAGKTYYYTVKAYAPDQYSEYDEDGLKTERLTAPTNLKVENKDKGTYLTWKKSTGAKQYVIYRSVGTGNYKKLYTTAKTYYTDKKATSNGTRYRYKVYAIDGDSISMASSLKKIYRLDRAVLSSLKNNSSKKMILKWKKNNGATGYEIEYATKSSFKNAKKLKVTSKVTTTKTISKLKKGTKYYVRIRSYKKVSGVTYYSAWSTSKNIKIKK